MKCVPDYLEKYAYDISTKKDKVTFKLKCTCGCQSFDVIKNHYTAEEVRLVFEYEKSLPRTGGHSIYGGIDANGNHYSYIKILGLFKKYVKLPKAPYFVGIEVIKAVCNNCKNEIICFDSRLHGLSSISDISEEKRNYLPHFDTGDGKSGKVVMVLEQDGNEENEPQLFTGIQIYIDAGNKRRLFYDQETD